MINTNFLKAAFKISISVLALYFVFTKVPFLQIWQQIKEVNLIFIFPAVVLFVLSKLIAANRLLIYFRTIGVQLDAVSNLKLYLLGMFYNLFLPGGIGGDGYKIYLLKKQGFSSTKRLLGTILVDRLSGLHALFCLLVLVFVFCPFEIPYQYAFLLLIPLSYLVYQVFIQSLFPYLKQTTKTTFIYSLGVQSLQLGSAFLLLTALGQNSSLAGYLFLFLVSSVVAALPLTIGGIGGREVTAFIGADLLHLNVEVAVAVSLYFYIITALVSFGGIYYLITPFEKQFYQKPEMKNAAE